MKSIFQVDYEQLLHTNLSKSTGMQLTTRFSTLISSGLALWCMFTWLQVCTCPSRAVWAYTFHLIKIIKFKTYCIVIHINFALFHNIYKLHIKTFKSNIKHGPLFSDKELFLIETCPLVSWVPVKCKTTCCMFRAGGDVWLGYEPQTACL